MAQRYGGSQLRNTYMYHGEKCTGHQFSPGIDGSRFSNMWLRQVSANGSTTTHRRCAKEAKKRQDTSYLVIIACTQTRVTARARTWASE